MEKEKIVVEILSETRHATPKQYGKIKSALLTYNANNPGMMKFLNTLFAIVERNKMNDRKKGKI